MFVRLGLGPRLADSLAKAGPVAAVALSTLAGPALLISVIGFVESMSVAQTLAAKRRQRVDPEQELIGLGAANIAAGFSGGYPVCTRR